MLETKDADPTTCLEWADVLFAWLRDGADTDVKLPRQPAEADSERGGKTIASSGGRIAEPARSSPLNADDNLPGFDMGADAREDQGDHLLYDADGEVVDLSPPREEDFTAFWHRIKGEPWSKTADDVTKVLGMTLAAWCKPDPKEGRDGNELGEAWRWCIIAWSKEGAE